MDHQRTYLTLFATLFLLAILTESSAAQQDTDRELRVRPDLWYNSVDGIRTGVRFRGRTGDRYGTDFHRVEGGVWLGLWFPSLPVSYSLDYIRTFPGLSEPGQEFHVKGSTMVREGYQRHGVEFRKRWQPGDEFRSFLELSAGYHLSRRFDDTYLLFRDLWGDRLLGNLHAEVEWQHRGETGESRVHLESLYNTIETPFQVSTGEVAGRLSFGSGWSVRGRFFGTVQSTQTEPEYQVFMASGAPIRTLTSPLLRSRGTIPPAWVRSGGLHYASGPNLRGYTASDMDSILNGTPDRYRRAASVTAEFDVPNPIQRIIDRMEMGGEFITFRSYLFGGAGLASGSRQSGDRREFAETGAGLAFGWNIPGESGRFRGFQLRYESPFWLSQPGDEPSWRWRHLVGLGAVITF